MSKHQVEQTVVEALQESESDDLRYQRLLKEAGIMVKPEKEMLSPELRVEKVKSLLDLLKMARETKDEKSAKKIRRTLRKKYGFKISEHIKIEVSI